MPTDDLIGAISAGDLKQIEKVVRTAGGKLCLDAPDSFGMTPLAKASQLGKLNIVQFLLREGAHADGIHATCSCSTNQTCISGGGSPGGSPSGGGTFRSPLVAATAAGHVRVVEALLACGAHVDSTHMYQMTCLHIACSKGWHKVVAALLDHGANINAQDKRGWTPLYHAAQRGHLSCVQLLLSVVASSSDDDDDEKTNPATTISGSSFPSSVENDRNKGNRAVVVVSTEAHSSSSLSSVQRSVSKPRPSSTYTRALQIGTPVWVRRKGQSTSQLLEGEVAYLGPVRFAKSQDWVGVRLTGPSKGQGKNNGVVQGITYFHTPVNYTPHSGLFVRRSAITVRRRPCSSKNSFQSCQVDSPSFHRLLTPLHVACERGRLPVVRYLIEHGNANLQARDQIGWTPFFGACYEGDLAVVQYLVQHFGDVNRIKNNSQETPLWIACLAGNLPVVDFLIANGGDVNTRNAKGVSPFFMACAQGRWEMVSSLLERGADPNAPNNEGVTPLGWACLRGCLKLAQYLVQQGGANLEAGCCRSGDSVGCNNAPPTILTPLWIASQHGNLELVRFLVFAGANLEALDPQTGFIPLAVAAWNGHIEVVRFLVLSGSQQQQPHLVPRGDGRWTTRTISRPSSMVESFPL